METLEGVKKIAVEACLKYTDAIEEIRQLKERERVLVDTEIKQLKSEVARLTKLVQEHQTYQTKEGIK
jgi:hypothetical protein